MSDIRSLLPFLLKKSAGYQSDAADVIVSSGWVMPCLPPESVGLWDDLQDVASIKRQGSIETWHRGVISRVVAELRSDAYLSYMSIDNFLYLTNMQIGILCSICLSEFSLIKIPFS